MGLSAERLSRVVGEIYEAVGTPDGFVNAVRRIREVTGASSGMLFTPLLDPGGGGYGFVDHVNPQFFALYRAHFWDKDPWARESDRKGLLRAGNTASDDQVLSQHELQKEEIYPDFLIPMDATRICCSILAVDGDPLIPRTYLSLFRGLRSRPFSDGDRQTLALLAPHMLQALRLAHQMRFAVSETDDLRAALHDLSRGIVLIDKDKQVVFANLTAEQLCAAQLGITMIRDSKAGRCVLRGSTAQLDRRLQEVLDAAVRRASSSALSAEPTVSPLALTGDGQLIVTAAPMRHADFAGGDRPCVVIYLEDAAVKSHPTERLYFKLFGLSPAEARLACALAAGDEPRAVALRQNVSENTVRTQIRSLLHKTGTRRLNALVALLTRIEETQAATRLIAETTTQRGF